MVGTNGCIKINSKSFFLTVALSGFTVGIEEKEEVYILWFDNLRLAEIDIKNGNIIWIEPANMVS